MTTTGPSFTWDVNPSTRPIVQSRLVKLLNEQPTRSETFTAAPAPVGGTTEHEFVVTEIGMDVLRVNLDWPTPDDLDLTIYRVNADGSRTQVASSGNIPGEKEEAMVADPAPGSYVLAVTNYASATPSYTLTAALFDATEQETSGLIEAYTLTCEKDGRVLQTVPVIVARGQQVKVDLKECARRW
jgi:hypothetical protein